MSKPDTSPFRGYAPGSQPPLDAPAYRSTAKRHPSYGLVALPGGHTATEITGPRFDPSRYPANADPARAGGHEALGKRIIVAGRCWTRMAGRCRT